MKFLMLTAVGLSVLVGSLTMANDDDVTSTEVFSGLELGTSNSNGNYTVVTQKYVVTVSNDGEVVEKRTLDGQLVSRPPEDIHMAKPASHVGMWANPVKQQTTARGAPLPAGGLQYEAGIAAQACAIAASEKLFEAKLMDYINGDLQNLDASFMMTAQSSLAEFAMRKYNVSEWGNVDAAINKFAVDARRAKDFREARYDQEWQRIIREGPTSPMGRMDDGELGASLGCGAMAIFAPWAGACLERPENMAAWERYRLEAFGAENGVRLPPENPLDFQEPLHMGEILPPVPAIQNFRETFDEFLNGSGQIILP